MAVAASDNGLEHPQLGVPVAVYPYRRVSGDVAFVNCRFEPKDFRPAHETRSGRWAWNLSGAPKLLYRLPDVERALREGETIWIVDGEKDADALVAAGVVATCCMRAQGWSLDLAEQLIGVRFVKIVADNDESGIGLKQARQVRELLVETTGVASADVEIVHAAAGKDAFDHLAAGHDLDDFLPVLDVEPPAQIEAAVETPIVETLRNFRERDLPPADSLVGTHDGTNLLPRFGWVMPWGPAGSGKTSILVDLLFHACSGIDWLGYSIDEPLRVVVIVNEGVPGELQRKLKQKLDLWPHGEQVLDNLAVWVSPWGEFTFRDEQHVAYVRSFALDFKADYVALDPLHTLATTNTGAPDETEAFKRTLQAFGVWADLGVITAHHANKSKLISGDWDRHPDTVIRLEKVPKIPATKITLEKARPADPDELGVPFELRWLVETLSYERHALLGEGPRVEDAELLDRIKTTLATSKPLSMNDLKAETEGTNTRIAKLAKQALKTGDLADVSTRSGYFLFTLPDRVAEWDESLRLGEAQLRMVEPDNRVVSPDEPPESTQAGQSESSSRHPRRGSTTTRSVGRLTDADADNPLMQGQP